MRESYFFYGTLAHAPLLQAVLGHLPALRPARAEGYAVRVALDGTGEPRSFPVLVPAPGSRAEGVLATLSPEDAARLAWYETGYRREKLTAQEETGGACEAWAFLPEPGRWAAGPSWDFALWQARWGELAPLAAEEFMALRGQTSAEAALARFANIEVRAASRLRAAEPRPALLRHAAGPDDVTIEALATPYAKFFAVEDYRLCHRTFRGGQSAVLTRAAFVSGDATVVLPYDARRDRVLLVEQFRTGPFARGDANPWSLETVAGRVDAGETPEAAARREAVEEAGVELQQLLAAPRFYPSPGAKSEYLYCYVGLCELPETAAALGGLEAEGEDIRAHVIGFDTMMELIATGEIENGPLIVLAYWLERQRARLRAEAEAGAGAEAGTAQGKA